jgi:hypothetical protein
MDWVLSKWPDCQNKRGIDAWQRINNRLRSSLRGWNGNWGGDMKKRKQDLLLMIQSLDQEAEARELQGCEWERRYSLEEELIDIYNKEEVMWQTRGGERWMLEGDANTAYFHGVANGRKRKCLIRSLEDNGEVISETGDLMVHITNYYKNMFGSERQSTIRLHQDLWDPNSKIYAEENEELTKPFTVTKLEEVVMSMRDGSAPGPDGFSSIFFKFFWHQIKGVLIEMLQDLRTGQLDLFRLNYGILTLIAKIKGANNIKQFRPICLLNVVYKIITKTLTLRLNRVANKVISPKQSAFVPGRFILDGVVVIHEVLHELAKSKQSGIVIKLDFEKAYDKVSWRFLEEVLRNKGFSELWIEWMMKVERSKWLEGG